MKCPLFMMFPEQPGTSNDCTEDSCAWYDYHSKRCAVLMVAVDMDRAVSQVNDLCLNLTAQLGNLNENLIKR